MPSLSRDYFFDNLRPGQIDFGRFPPDNDYGVDRIRRFLPQPSTPIDVPRRKTSIHPRAVCKKCELPFYSPRNSPTEDCNSSCVYSDSDSCSDADSPTSCGLSYLADARFSASHSDSYVAANTFRRLVADLTPFRVPTPLPRRRRQHRRSCTRRNREMCSTAESSRDEDEDEDVVEPLLQFADDTADGDGSPSRPETGVYQSYLSTSEAPRDPVDAVTHSTPELGSLTNISTPATPVVAMLDSSLSSITPIIITTATALSFTTAAMIPVTTARTSTIDTRTASTPSTTKNLKHIPPILQEDYSKDQQKFQLDLNDFLSRKKLTSESSKKRSPDLFECSAKGEIVIIQAIIGRDAPCLHEVDSSGCNALFYACYFGQIRSLQLLINMGLNVNHMNKHGQTPLMISCICDDLELARLLLDNGAAIDPQDKYGCTALMYACENDNQRIIKKLLGSGAKVSCQNSRGCICMEIHNGMSDNITHSVLMDHLNIAFNNYW